MNIEKFKYTTNKDRKIFSSFLKQHIGDITDLVLEMPWDSYEYKGPCILSQTTEDEEQIYTPTEIIAKCYDLPYHFIGGCVYYLYTKKYPDKNKYMDLTGDIDIYLDIPKIFSINGREDIKYLNDFCKSVFEDEQGINMNDCIKDYCVWILVHFFKLFSSEIKDDFYNELQEYRFNEKDKHILSIDGSKLVKNIHNKIYFYVIRENNMTKIQIECKVKHMEHPDHLVEYVLKTDIQNETDETWDSPNSYFKKKVDIFDINNKKYNIQKYKDLINHNMRAMNDRIVLADKDNSHKFFNHIARIRYLNYIYDEQNMNNDVLENNMAEIIYSLWEDKENIRKYNYEEMNNKKFIETMVGNFIKQLSLKINSMEIFVITPKKGRRITLRRNEIIEKYNELIKKCIEIDILERGRPEKKKKCYLREVLLVVLKHEKLKV